MLGKRIINTGAAGAACTTDTVQILDGVPFDSIATYELESDATNSSATGYIGKAAVFNGSSYIDTGIDLDTYDETWSISLWVKFTFDSSYRYILGDLSVSSALNGFVIDTSPTGHIRFRFRNSSTSVATISSTNTYGDGDWHHIVAVKGSTNNSLYVDGSDVNSTPTVNNINHTTNITLGKAGNYNGYYKGSIDQVRIYNKELIQSNVDTLYAETASSTISIGDLLAYYKFQGDATDETTNYDGTASSGVTYNEYDGTASNVTYATGKFGNAAVFNGSSSSIDLGTINFGTTSQLTISMWIKPNSSQTAYNQIIDREHNSSGGGGWVIQQSNASTNQYYFALNEGSPFKVSPVVSLTANVWSHLVFTINASGNLDAYLNNVQVITSDTGYGSLDNSLNLETIISGYAEYPGRQFNGSIDQVRIYDKAISAANVAELYAETLATSQTNISLNTPSGVAYYKMNDATDETGSYDGTATNVNFNVAGKFGNAGEFNGSSSVVTLPSSLNTTYVTPTGSFSASCWVNFDTVGTSIQQIINWNTTSNIELALNGVSQGAGKIVLSLWDSSYVHLISTTTVTASTWYHIAVTHNNGSWNLYIDGSLEDTDTKTIVQPTSSVALGKRQNNTQYLDGKIDQVRIFDRAITQSEVEVLYNEVYCQPTIVPTDHFEAVTYTGNEGTKEISDLDFAPDLVWIKHRNQPYTHALHDSVRGVRKLLRSNETSAEYNTTNTPAGTLTSFDDDGFTVIEDSTWTLNDSNTDYISWNWKAGGAFVTDTSGDLDADISANQEAGFSIVKYRGNGTSGTKIPHGLGEMPDIVLVKSTSVANSWQLYSTSISTASLPTLNGRLHLENTTQALFDSYTVSIDDSTFEWTGLASTFDYFNKLNVDYVAYLFRSVEGMSKFGSYVGTGGSGNSIVTGFRPAFVMVKSTSSANTNWVILDNKRADSSVDVNKWLKANESHLEDTGANVSFNSNGFTFNLSSNNFNGNGETYIYLAFAEENTQPEPELANSFNVVTYDGDGGSQAVTGLGFTPDLVWIKNRDTGSVATIHDTISGAGYYLVPSATGGLSTLQTDVLSSFDDDGFTVGASSAVNGLNNEIVAWCWKASNDSTINNDGSISSVVSANPASGFSIVKYTSTSSTSTIGHGLDNAPELIILKSTTNTGDWQVYSSVTGNNKKLLLNSTAAASTSGIWSNTSPTSSVFTSAFNGVGSVIAYCFHSTDNQKIGSYSGSGGAGNAQNLGFAPAFVMVKSTNVATNWAIFDTSRTGKRLQADLSNAEGDDTRVTLTSTGFEFTGAAFNETGRDWIYLAIKAN